MIKKINRLKKFGIFEDFSWNDDLHEFKQKNLIYGLNYSGKTTFSKLLHNLEVRKKQHFVNAEYQIELSDSTSYNQENLSNFPYTVKVFNAVYISDVFSWDSSNKNDGIHPISFYLGDEAGEIQPQIENIKSKRIPTIDKVKANLLSQINTFEEYNKQNGKFSKHSKEIRENYLSNRILQTSFQKNHFKEIIDKIKYSPQSYLIPVDQIESIRQKALSDNELKVLPTEFPLVEKLNQLHAQIETLLKDSADPTVNFQELDEDEELFNWVQTGLSLHKESDTCKFCSKELDKLRIQNLNQYYSEKLREIQRELEKLTQLIEAEEKSIKGLSFPHESLFPKHLKSKLRGRLDSFEIKKKEYLTCLKILKRDIDRKANGNFFIPIDISECEIVSLKETIEEIIEVIIEHNEFVQKFDENKKNALTQILDHYVSVYALSENYLSQELQDVENREKYKRCERLIESCLQKLNNLEAKLKNTVKGQLELNTFLRIFLNRVDIKIEVINDKFILQRGEEPASNLSEGEKSAISFAYFLTELKSIREENKIKDTIICIDDPISSLDSNHIFQIRSLIQEFFKTIDYCQLFISTHNFEFLSIMLDSNLFSNLNRKDTREDKLPFYLVKRLNKNSSVLSKLPLVLRAYKSEYVHLFQILNNYHKSNDKENYDNLLLLPNALRRFLEMYTLMKFPKGYSEIDERIKKVFKFEDQAFHHTKLYHWFSHQQQLEKVGFHDSKLMQIDDAIKEVIDHIKNEDEMHYNGLISLN